VKYAGKKIENDNFLYENEQKRNDTINYDTNEDNNDKQEVIDINLDRNLDKKIPITL